MGSLTVSSGLCLTSAIEQLVIVGRNKLLKSLKYEGDLAKKLADVGVENRVFNAAIKRLQPSGTLPLFLNSAKVLNL